MGGDDFCSQNKDVINDLNYMDMYDSSCLPNGGTGFSPTLINSSGIVENTALTSYVKTLLPVSTDNISKEYCFYYKRYNYALQELLIVASVSQTGSDYFALKEDTIQLNSLLNQLLQILQMAILLQSASEDDSDNSEDYATAREILTWHMAKLQDSDMEANAKKSMIDYTIEKNSSSRNLLAIYGFLNIVAIGMLAYLYRSSK